MRRGLSPTAAAEEALSRIVKFYPNFSGAIVAANISGHYGAACHGLPDGFPFSVMNPEIEAVEISHVTCS